MKSGIEGESPEPDSWIVKTREKQQQRKIFTVDQGYNKTIENKEKHGGTKMNTQNNTVTMIHIDEEASARFAEMMADFLARSARM